MRARRASRASAGRTWRWYCKKSWRTEPRSRAGIAEAVGLSRSTVSSLVGELIERGFLLERELERDGSRGQARDGWWRSRIPPWWRLGLEINVDYLAACVLDLAGNVRYEQFLRHENRKMPVGAVLDALADLAERALESVEREGLHAGRHHARRTRAGGLFQRTAAHGPQPGLGQDVAGGGAGASAWAGLTTTSRWRTRPTWRLWASSGSGRDKSGATSSASRARSEWVAPWWWTEGCCGSAAGSAASSATSR